MRLRARIVVLRHAANGRNAHHDRGDNERNNKGQPEIRQPVIHQVKRLGNNDHERCRDRRKPRGDDGGFLAVVVAGLIHAVRNQQAQGIGAEERGDGVDGGFTRRLKHRAHNRLHHHADEFHEAEANQQAEEDRANRNQQANRDHKLVQNERANVRVVQKRWAEVEDQHCAQHHRKYGEEGEDRAGVIFLPTAGNELVNRARNDGR